MRYTFRKLRNSIQMYLSFGICILKNISASKIFIPILNFMRRKQLDQLNCIIKLSFECYVNHCYTSCSTYFLTRTPISLVVHLLERTQNVDRQSIYYLVGLMYIYRPISVAARSEAQVYGRSSAAIVGSNPTGGMEVCLL